MRYGIPSSQRTLYAYSGCREIKDSLKRIFSQADLNKAPSRPGGGGSWHLMPDSGVESEHQLVRHCPELMICDDVSLAYPLYKRVLAALQICTIRFSY